MDSFDVETYRARVQIRRSGNPVRTIKDRVIELESPALAHGIVMRALFSFSTSFNTWSGATAAAGFFNDSDPLRPMLVGWFPEDEFPLWYDILRHESPVKVLYTIRPINGAKYVSNIGVGTTDEPVGEGPADLDA